MDKNRFFHPSMPIRLDELAKLADAKLENPQYGDRMIHNASILNLATENEISFLANEKYRSMLKNSKAGAVILTAEHKADAPTHMPLLISENPYKGFAKILSYFYPKRQSNGVIHPTAYIDESATIGNNVEIGAFSVIEANAHIGDDCIIDSHCSIGNQVRVGAKTIIEAGAKIQFCHIGKACHFHQGVVIGARGFGFAMDENMHVDMPQIGGVWIGDDVEIGANCTIDRGMYDDTVIGDRCRLDNLVHIAHNVSLGKACVVAGQCGISGSTKLGDYVVMGGQVGIAGHIEIGNHVMIAAKSGVTKSVKAHSVVAGFPARPIQQWHKQNAVINKLIKRKTAQ